MTKHSFIARKNAFIRMRGNFPARIIAKATARTRVQKSRLSYVPRRALCRLRGEQIPHHDVYANVTITNILRHPRTNWDWRELSRSPHITLNTIRAHSHLPWVWFVFCAENPNVCIKDILDTAGGIFTLSRTRKRKLYDWNFEDLSINPSVKVADMIANPQFPWNLNDISRNSSVTIADILAYPHLPWRFYELSYWRNNISASDMIAHPQFPWSYSEIVNKNDFVFETALPFIRNSLSYLSNAPGITMDDIENHPDLPWDWNQMITNPNMTPEFLEKYIDRLPFRFVHRNSLDISDRAFVIEAKKEANKRAIALKPFARSCVGDCVARTIARYIDFE